MFRGSGDRGLGLLFRVQDVQDVLERSHEDTIKVH